MQRVSDIVIVVCKSFNESGRMASLKPRVADLVTNLNVATGSVDHKTASHVICYLEVFRNQAARKRIPSCHCVAQEQSY